MRKICFVAVFIFLTAVVISFILAYTPISMIPPSWSEIKKNSDLIVIARCVSLEMKEYNEPRLYAIAMAKLKPIEILKGSIKKDSHISLCLGGVRLDKNARFGGLGGTRMFNTHYGYDIKLSYVYLLALKEHKTEKGDKYLDLTAYHYSLGIILEGYPPKKEEKIDEGKPILQIRFSKLGGSTQWGEPTELDQWLNANGFKDKDKKQGPNPK